MSQASILTLLEEIRQANYGMKEELMLSDEHIRTSVRAEVKQSFENQQGTEALLNKTEAMLEDSQALFNISQGKLRETQDTLHRTEKALNDTRSKLQHTEYQLANKNSALGNCEQNLHKTSENLKQQLGMYYSSIQASVRTGYR